MYQPSVRDVIRISCYLLILFALLLTGVLFYLSQLDLDDYRDSLEARLNSALNQPVKIGHSSLTFSRGLALSFDDVQIGPDEKPLAKIPRITATLKITPLFDGRFVLGEIHVKEPDIQLWLPFPDNKKKKKSRFLLASLGVNSLNIDNGSLKIHQKGSLPTVSLSKLSAVLEGWRLGQVGLLKIGGKLDNYGAGFIFETRVPRHQGASQWRKESFDTRLTVTDFATTTILPAEMQNLPRHVTLKLSISGTPAAGATLDAKLIGSSLKKTLFNLSGQWLSAEDQESVTAIKGELFKVPLAGELYLLRQNSKNYLAGKLGAQNIAITPALLKEWNVTDTSYPINGKLERFNLELKDSWGDDGSALNNLILSGGLIAREIRWKEAGPVHLQKLSFDFSLKNKILALNNGVLVAHEQPVTFSGKILSVFRQPQIEIGIPLDPQLDVFTPQLSLPEGWTLTGHIPAQLQLSGALSRPFFHLTADLNQVQTTLGTLFKKDVTDSVSLDLKGQLKTNCLRLETATLSLNDTKIAASGYFRSLPEGQTYQLAITPVDLRKLQHYSPLLTMLNAAGTLAAEISQQQTGLQGRLTLDGVGAHLTSLIGNLNNTNGQIDLDRHGLTFQGLHASLGQSEFTLTGILSNWSKPRFSLDLTSKKVHAHDLIFANRHLTLYDLDGHLDISASGLEFSPVKVRLEDDTFATVTGDVSFNHPEVHLDIQSNQADIFDVINLFVGPHSPPPPGGKPHRVPVIITVDAKNGTLGGLRFHNAKGLIISDDKRLTIFPLKFNSSEGWCQARILFDYNDDSTPLKISGHTENMDASMLHQHLFEREGLVSGQLKGDFYLEGNPADGQFWTTAKGGIHAEITDGVLRKFRGLAKVFSLLNVSQLFSGKLPDMDREGMPFSLVKGSILFDSGQATTKDLQVDSVAMNLSIVGSSDLINDRLNLNLGIMPLGTVDKIITTIPVAGWILAGENKALVTAHFIIEGSSKNPEVRAVPIESVSDTVIGIVRRTFGLPGKLIKDIGTAFQKKPTKKGAE